MIQRSKTLPEKATAHGKDIAVLAVQTGRPAVDISGRMDPDGLLTWEAPPGAWRIMRFVASRSYEVAEAIDWTDDLADEFRKQHGYDPLPYLPALFDPSALDPKITGRFLYDYRKTVSDLIIEDHFRTVRDVLAKSGVRLLAEAGHGGSARVDALKALGSADIPMGEFWNHERFWVTKEAASATSSPRTPCP